jgi:hypothetical protein
MNTLINNAKLLGYSIEDPVIFDSSRSHRIIAEPGFPKCFREKLAALKGSLKNGTPPNNFSRINATLTKMKTVQIGRQDAFPTSHPKKNNEKLLIIHIQPGIWYCPFQIGSQAFVFPLLGNIGGRKFAECHHAKLLAVGCNQSGRGINHTCHLSNTLHYL